MTREEPSAQRQIAVGIACSGVSAVIRLALQSALGSLVPFITFFPALLIASYCFGPWAGAACLVASTVASLYFFLGGMPDLPAAAAIAVLAFLIIGGAIVALAAVFRRSLRGLSLATESEAALVAALNEKVSEHARLADDLQRQAVELKQAQSSLQAIFDSSSEGFALCRLICDENGLPRDYQVLDVNRAHAVLTGATRERMLALPITQVAPPIDPRWIETAAKVVRTGTPSTFEVQSRATGLWLEIHMSPVADDLFSQTFIDATDRHRIEEQRRALVAEMNHRVKNNFQMVASILNLQARNSPNEESREQLTSAARRVQLLAALHESLAPETSVGSVDIDSFLGRICDRLRASLEASKNLSLGLAACPGRVPAAIALYIGFIVNELVSEAVMRALALPVPDDISVTLDRDGADYVLTVRADALQGGFDPAQGERLGMRLVKGFVSQINGALQIGAGTEGGYLVRFPSQSADNEASRPAV